MIFRSILLSFCVLIVCLTVSAQKNDEDRRLPDGTLSDRCSWFFDGDWGDCCVAHDKDYFVGGTKAMRMASDQRLRQCIINKGHKYVSKIMYVGVRIGGVGFLRMPFSWGFGKRRMPKVEKPVPTK